MSRQSNESLRELIRDYRKDQIIEVAKELFGERGTTEVAMDEIACAAGVARSTLYVYFSNRDELLRACLKGMYDKLMEAIAGVWERGATPVERLGALVHAMLERIDDNPAFFRLALAAQVWRGGTDGSEDPRAVVGAELLLISLDMAAILEELVNEGSREGVFKEIEPARAATLIGQQIYGALSIRSTDPLPPPIDTATNEICDFIVYGLSSNRDDRSQHR